MNYMWTAQFATYLVVGGLTAIIYFGFIYVGTEILALDYRLCVTIAYIAGVCFHFLANRTFTFRATTGRLAVHTGRYIILLGLNYAITLAVVFLCVDKLGFSVYIGAAIAIGLTVFVGYAFSKFWVFRHD